MGKSTIDPRGRSAVLVSVSKTMPWEDARGDRKTFGDANTTFEVDKPTCKQTSTHARRLFGFAHKRRYLSFLSPNGHLKEMKEDTKRRDRRRNIIPECLEQASVPEHATSA